MNTSRWIFDLQGILWRLPPDGGQAVALTDASDDLRWVQLSPDGQWLTAQSFATGAWDIVVMRTDGSERRNLTADDPDDREPAWSADGKSILFTSDRTGNEDIWSVDVATGTLRQIWHRHRTQTDRAGAGRQVARAAGQSGRPVSCLRTSDSA